MRIGARAAGLLIGVVADAVFGDPRRGHPVAAFGTVAGALERRAWRDSRAAGAGYTALLVGGTVGLGALAEWSATGPRPRRSAGGARSTGPGDASWRSRVPSAAMVRPSVARGRIAGAGPLPGDAWWSAPGGSGATARHSPGHRGDAARHSRSRRRELAQMLVTGAATWAVLGGTSLVREGELLARSLDGGDLTAARARIPHLCARDPELLDADGMARAGVESLAENTSDAVVGPLFWGAVAGVPGLLGYRAVNTLDAMVGYRSPRYARFGWASARLDDLVNLAPARVTAAVTVLLAPVVGGSPADALRAWRRDASGHPSPNAGPVEATAAGALGLRLGGRTEYAYGAEDRATLGDGRAPAPADLHRAARLSRLITVAATVLAATTAVVHTRVRSAAHTVHGM